MGRRYCCVLNCPSRVQKSEKSMFSPPLKNKPLLSKWGKALQGHVSPSCCPYDSKTFVCELHFKPHQLDRMFVTKLPDGSTWSEKKARVTLVPNAVPCIFNISVGKKENYVFDIEEDIDDSEMEEESDEGSEEVEQQHQEDEDDKNVDLKPETTKDDSKTSDQPEVMVVDEGESGSRNGNENIEIIFSEIVGDGSDHESEAESNDCKAAEIVFCSKYDSNVVSSGEPENEKSGTSGSSLIDVRKILGPPQTDKCVINDINQFTRLCRKYVASERERKGRPSQMDLYGLDPPSPGSEKNVYLYPTAKLDVETLVSHIDHVKFPSENWFCTVRDGSPTFLCWNGNSIHKMVVFDKKTKNLNATVYLGEVQTSFSEIAKPRSIHEVNNILKLVDSAEKCPVEESDVCKGYFFPATTNGVDSCQPCRSALFARSSKDNPFTLKLVKDSAQEIVSRFQNWSFTVLGTSIIFIGWKKPYVPVKLYIIDSNLKAEVIFDGESGLFDDICFPQSVEDVQLAIRFLDGCVKCSGVDDEHRSDRCRGFVFHEKRRTRNETCKACADLKKKLFRGVPGSSLVKRTETSLPPASLKSDARKASPPWIKEEDDSSDHNLEADEEHILLLNALDSITLPSSRWTYVAVDGTVIFQCWKDDFTLLKKILINQDLSVEVHVLDRRVGIEDIDVVSSVEDVERILNTVDCLRVCQGYDESYRKDKDCTGYVCDPDDGEADKQGPYRCPKCAARRRAQGGLAPRMKPPSKSRIVFVDRVMGGDFDEPSSKKVALEITLSPDSTPPRCPGSPTDDER